MNTQQLNSRRYAAGRQRRASSIHTFVLIPEQRVPSPQPEVGHQYLFLDNHKRRQFRRGKLSILTGMRPVLMGVDEGRAEGDFGVTFSYG